MFFDESRHQSALGQNPLETEILTSQGQGAEEDGAGSDVDIGMDDDEDERHLEAADKFEAEHNFRFEVGPALFSVSPHT